MAINQYLQRATYNPQMNLEILKSEAIKAGGNTIECCGIEKEETIVSGENPDSGEINCVGVVQHFANVYKCKK